MTPRHIQILFVGGPPPSDAEVQRVSSAVAGVYETASCPSAGQVQAPYDPLGGQLQGVLDKAPRVHPDALGSIPASSHAQAQKAVAGSYPCGPDHGCWIPYTTGSERGDFIFPHRIHPFREGPVFEHIPVFLAEDKVSLIAVDDAHQHLLEHYNAKASLEYAQKAQRAGQPYPVQIGHYVHYLGQWVQIVNPSDSAALIAANNKQQHILDEINSRRFSLIAGDVDVPELDTHIVPHAVLDVLKERLRQDAKWGGPEHDDRHSEREFISYIKSYTELAYSETNKVQAWANHGVRNRLIQVAALAVAAVESLDRKRANCAQAPQPQPACNRASEYPLGVFGVAGKAELTPDFPRAPEVPGGIPSPTQQPEDYARFAQAAGRINRQPQVIPHGFQTLPVGLRDLRLDRHQVLCNRLHDERPWTPESGVENVLDCIEDAIKSKFDSMEEGSNAVKALRVLKASLPSDPHNISASQHEALRLLLDGELFGS